MQVELTEEEIKSLICQVSSEMGKFKNLSEQSFVRSEDRKRYKKLAEHYESILSKLKGE